MIYFYLNKHQKIFSVLIFHLTEKTAKDISHINKSFLTSLIIFKSIFKPLRTTGLNYCNYVNSIPGSGRSPGIGNGNPLQYSCLEIFMDSKAWWATVHGGHKKSQIQLSDWAHTQMLVTAKPSKVSFVICPFELSSSLVTVKSFLPISYFALYLLFTFSKCSKETSVNNFSKFSKTSNYFSHDSPTSFLSVAPTWPGLDAQPLFSSFPLTSSYIELLFPVSYGFFFWLFSWSW